MHHGKLNLQRPISASSVSRVSVLTISGGVVEGPKEVPSLSRLTYLLYSSREMGWALSGRERVRVNSWHERSEERRVSC